MPIKTRMDELSNLILKNTGVHREYTDMDLMNAMVIFNEVFLAKMYDFHKDKITAEQLEQLAKEAGKSLHQTTLLFTGVDLKKVL